ncbi:tetratricopeptide repeat protein [Geojedonia litorea]|uniref:Tetratricopeptide repeat protein n=1 Tax=Geojedonia litorea TaxID=1268269 RepID=A0ABV9N307_9FLAO
MKKIVLYIAVLISALSFAQDKEKAQLLAEKKANDYVYEANELVNEDNFISAEMEYRKAISKQPNTVAGTYNLGNSYYHKGNFDEALWRHQQAAKNATDKSEKHKAFHNIGNILMQNKQCKEAVEAYKNALRNNPSDDETRYNLALAKVCAEQQQDENKDDKQDDKKDQDQDNKDQNKDQQQENQDQKDQGDQKEDKGKDKQNEEGKPKEDQGKGDQEQKQQPRPQQLSPQQIKNLLEAMNNQEQKVQEKINAEKQKGVKVKAEKDW